MNRDFAVMADGTRKLIDDFPDGALGVACQKGLIRKIVHIRQPRSKSAGTFRKSRTVPLTASQMRCVEGQP